MKYLFVKRNKDTGRPEIVAEFFESTLTWRGTQVEQIKNFLENTKFSLLKDEEFDEKNKKHRKLLPQLIHGDYFWVRAE